MSDVNDSMVNDFFSDAGGLIDQDTGSPVDLNSVQNSDGLFGQQNGQTPKNDVQQQVAQPGLQQPQQQQTQQGQPTQTFDKTFFADDGKGNQVFDANKALNFFTQQSNGSFQYQGIAQPVSIPQPQSGMPQPQQIQQPQEPAKAPWEVEFEEEQKLRSEARNRYMTYRNFLDEAVKAGYSGNDAIAYADQMAMDNAEKEFAKMRYEQSYKQKEEQRKQQEESDKLRSIEPTSKVNLSKAYNQLGGEDKFNALIFGAPTPDGKLAGGFGIDIINREFDRDHKGQQLPKDPAQLQEVYKKWYTNYTADQNNLQFLVDVSKARMQMMLFPQIVQHIQSVRDTGIQQVAQSTVGNPSGINIQKGQSEPDSLDKYFGFDTV